MPDVFIPLDTNTYHSSISQASRKDLIRSFAFDYTNRQRTAIQKLSIDAFIQDFELKESTWQQLSKKCREAGVDLKMNTWDMEDKKFVHTQLKAYIARNIWNDAGFYPIIHQIDNTFQEAIRL